jgi:hypothetical protein
MPPLFFDSKHYSDKANAPHPAELDKILSAECIDALCVDTWATVSKYNKKLGPIADLYCVPVNVTALKFHPLPPDPRHLHLYVCTANQVALKIAFF